MTIRNNKKNKRRLLSRIRDFLYQISLRDMIWIFFSISAVSVTLFIFVFVYNRFSTNYNTAIEEENQALMKQVNQTLSLAVREVMKLSDVIQYNVLKNREIHEETTVNSIKLLYKEKEEYIESISLFDDKGELIFAVPNTTVDEHMNVTEQTWYIDAMCKAENIHFGQISVQNILNHDGYRWTMPLSRSVQYAEGQELRQAVLLIQIKHSLFEKILSSASVGEDGYVYLIDGEGDIIYHPLHQLVKSGLYQEKNVLLSTYKDGVYLEKIEGVTRNTIVKSVGYTGWKLIGVAPNYGLSFTTIKGKLFLLFILCFFIVIITNANSLISIHVTKPIYELERAVKSLEAGDLDTRVQVTGFREVEHLADSIDAMAVQIKRLMNDIVVEHESKRKNELDVLQSQINPHFLYNTLDIIVWMVENEQQSQAVRVVTALARFFRISLSNGRRFISVEQEVEHIKNYLMIQEIRFKDRFTYQIEVEEAAKSLSTIKLILQPIIENAIYHGMEFMDGDGQILVKVYLQEGDLIFDITDNGLGMTEEQVYRLMNWQDRKESEEVMRLSKRGSGIGVKNVDERIRLYYGRNYGLTIESEPDEGTKVTIRIPAIEYEEMLKEL